VKQRENSIDTQQEQKRAGLKVLLKLIASTWGTIRHCSASLLMTSWNKRRASVLFFLLNNIRILYCPSSFLSNKMLTRTSLYIRESPRCRICRF
jgi:hypothetical protein